MLGEVYKMGQKKPYYTPEFKSEAVGLLRSSGKLVSELAKNIGVSDSALRKCYDGPLFDLGSCPGC